MKTLIRSKHSFQSGFTLIEVLITLVIVAVGLLGLASLQLRAMQFVHGAYIQTQVQVLAYDMLDRLRANRIEALETPSYVLAVTDTPSAPTNCATTVCTATQMAAFDIYEWRKILNEHLPQGKGAIALEDLASGGRMYTIQVQWLDNRSIEVTDAASFAKRFETFTFKVEL